PFWIPGLSSASSSGAVGVKSGRFALARVGLAGSFLECLAGSRFGFSGFSGVSFMVGILSGRGGEGRAGHCYPLVPVILLSRPSAAGHAEPGLSAKVAAQRHNIVRFRRWVPALRSRTLRDALRAPQGPSLGRDMIVSPGSSCQTRTLNSLDVGEPPLLSKAII